MDGTSSSEPTSVKFCKSATTRSRATGCPRLRMRPLANSVSRARRERSGHSKARYSSTVRRRQSSCRGRAVVAVTSGIISPSGRQVWTNPAGRSAWLERRCFIVSLSGAIQWKMEKESRGRQDPRGGTRERLARVGCAGLGVAGQCHRAPESYRHRVTPGNEWVGTVYEINLSQRSMTPRECMRSACSGGSSRPIGSRSPAGSPRPLRSRKRLGGSLTILVFALLAFVGSTHADTVTVAPDGSAEYRDIQRALDAAEGGDTVLVRPGRYVVFEPLDFNRTHTMDGPAGEVKDLILVSEAGPEETVLMRQGTDSGAIIWFISVESSESVLEGFTITIDRTGVSLPPSPGIYVQDSSPRISNRRCAVLAGRYQYGRIGEHRRRDSYPPVSLQGE